MNNQTTCANEILNFERDSYQQFQAGNFDKVIGYLAEDILLFNPGADIIVGREHEMTGLEEASKTEGLELSWEPTDVSVSESEDMAWVYGVIRIKTPDDMEHTEKYVTIWEKKGDLWQIVLQMRNANQ